MNELEQTLQQIFGLVTELERLLFPLEKDMNKLFDIPFKEMSITEKVKVAQFILKSAEFKRKLDLDS